VLLTLVWVGSLHGWVGGAFGRHECLGVFYFAISFSYFLFLGRLAGREKAILVLRVSTSFCFVHFVYNFLFLASWLGGNWGYGMNLPASQRAAACAFNFVLVLVAVGLVFGARLDVSDGTDERSYSDTLVRGLVWFDFLRSVGRVK
jgi:hypothetical protein